MLPPVMRQNNLAADHPQTLLIDADDTLWENNIYFERVIRAAQDLLEPWGVDPLMFRIRLNEAEREHIGTYGYGTRNFTRSLVTTFEEFLPQEAGAASKIRIRDLAMAIMDHPLELLDGVRETLHYLSGRHSLFLVTKGDESEQSRKIEASDLSRFFRGVEILPEKNAAAFAHLIAKHRWNPAHTWMIGNSPRSDINPALTAGIKAVYIPHAHTWTLEQEEPLAHPRLTRIETFADLRLHF
jgi:putative hydrolase of the HAD superfamily